MSVEHYIVACMAKPECADPDPGVVERHCDGCGQPVWVSPVTIQFLVTRLGEPWRLMCHACGNPFLKTEKEVTVIVPVGEIAKRLVERIRSKK